MPGPLKQSHCPVCGDPLLMVFNSWERSDGIYRHEGHHADNPGRDKRGLVVRVCSWAEPMAVALKELAAELYVGFRDGHLPMDALNDDIDPIVLGHMRELAEAEAQ